MSNIEREIKEFTKTVQESDVYYVVIYDKKQSDKLISDKLFSEMVQHTANLLNIENENEIESKDLKLIDTNLILFLDKNKEGYEKYINEKFKVKKYPCMFKFYLGNAVNFSPELIYITKKTS